MASSSPAKPKIYLHAILTKLHPSVSDDGEKYDGLLVTQPDAEKMVQGFYNVVNQKNGEKGEGDETAKIEIERMHIPVNYDHKQDYAHQAGRVIDIYVDNEKQSVNIFMEVHPKNPAYDHVDKLLSSDSKAPLGVSMELAFDYINKGENNTITSETRVSSKKLTGVSLVKVPDHGKDGTFVTSFVKSDDVRDLSRLQDNTLDTYLKRLQNNKDKNVFADYFLKRFHKSLFEKPASTTGESVAGTLF